MVEQQQSGITDIEPQPKEPVSYTDLLMGQLRGIAAFSTMVNPAGQSGYAHQFISAVNILDILLLPFHDDLYRQEKNAAYSALVTFLQPYAPDHEVRDVKNFEYAHDLLSLEIRLMHRRNLLVRQVIGEEVDADEGVPPAAATQEEVIS